MTNWVAILLAVASDHSSCDPPTTDLCPSMSTPPSAEAIPSQTASSKIRNLLRNANGDDVMALHHLVSPAVSLRSQHEELIFQDLTDYASEIHSRIAISDESLKCAFTLTTDSNE